MDDGYLSIEGSDQLGVNPNRIGVILVPLNININRWWLIKV